MASRPVAPIPPDHLPFSTILVTGADGFVGRYMTPAIADLLQPGARLIGVSHRQATGADGIASLPFDLEEPASVAACLRTLRPDLIVHLAGQASVGASKAAAMQTWSINFSGSFALAEAIAAYVPTCTLFFVSTLEVYGRAFNRGPATETTPVEPASVYSRSKAAAEAMLADVLPAECQLIAVRPSNHTGVGQDTRFVIPSFAAQIAKLEKQGSGEILVGNLDAERDFMDVRDVVAAYLGLLRRSKSLPARDTFNLVSGRVRPIGDVLERLLTMSGAPIEVVVDSARTRSSDIPRAAADASKLREITGWRPVHAFDDTIRMVLDEHRAKLV